MHPAHVAISLFNLLCGTLVLSLFLPGENSLVAKAAPFGVIGGYFANLTAIVVAIALLILLAIRASAGKARSTFQEHWLGLFNGAFVVVFWGAVFFT